MTLAQKVEHHFVMFRDMQRVYGVKVRASMQSEDQNEVRIVLEKGASNFAVVTICEGEHIHEYETTHSTFTEAMRDAAVSLATCFED